MNALSKIEEYLIDLGISYQEISKGAWLIDDDSKGLPPMVVSVADPIVVIRAVVMPVPEKNSATLFEELLRLNASDFLHGAYAIDGHDIVAIDTLEYANMDKNEFGASLEALGFALAQHFPILSRIVAQED
ncbi:MAG: hypothetical protein ABFC81_00410 [Rectinema sp.]